MISLLIIVACVYARSAEEGIRKIIIVPFTCRSNTKAQTGTERTSKGATGSFPKAQGRKESPSEEEHDQERIIGNRRSDG